VWGDRCEVGGGGSHAVVNRRGPGYRLLDKPRNQASIGLQLAERIVVFAQCPEPAGNGRRRRIVTSGRDDHVITDRLEMIDGFAVDLRIRDNACKVLGWTSPAALHERDKVRLKFPEQTKQLSG